jgi:hypothetical protein
LSKSKYSTIRELEHKNAGTFKKAGIIAIAGLLMIMFGSGTIISVIGIVALLGGVAIAFFGMVWMIKLQKEPTRHLFCPYCASKNDVFVSVKEFPCDICHRRIAVSPNGQPIPVEPIDDDD